MICLGGKGKRAVRSLRAVGALPVSCVSQRMQLIGKLCQASVFPVQAKGFSENSLALLFAGIRQEDQESSSADFRQRIHRPGSLHQRSSQQI